MPDQKQGSTLDPKRIGKYDVVERIGDGGFATLFKGHDPFLKRSVAIKVCVSEDAELRQQFLREAEIAGRLDHPNIVRTFDFGFEAVGPYLIQEYLDGEDLSHKINRGDQLSLRGKLGLLQEIAEGLAYSHQQGVLHLDIKPANIRLPEGVGGPAGQVKILDFGIARLASSDSEHPLGGMVGTAGYLPPEQVLGGDVDARADVFAFGAVAYELISYRRPFSGETVQELLKQVLEGEHTPLGEVWADCPESVAGFVGRCLERDPASRYQSLGDLLADLKSVLSYFPAPTETEEWVVVAPPEEPPPTQGRGAETELVAAPFELDEVLDAAAEDLPGLLPVEDLRPEDDSALEDGAVAEDAVVVSEAARRGGRSGVLGWVAVAAATAIAAVALAGRFGPGPPQELVPRTPSVAPAAADVSPSRPPGVLMVSAVPWGEVKGVFSADGHEVQLPPTTVTPLRLVVPSGSYRVEVTGPEAEESWTCNTHIVEGATHICHATLAQVSVTQYWKEMGWWR